MTTTRDEVAALAEASTKLAEVKRRMPDDKDVASLVNRWSAKQTEREKTLAELEQDMLREEAACASSSAERASSFDEPSWSDHALSSVSSLMSSSLAAFTMAIRSASSQLC